MKKLILGLAVVASLVSAPAQACGRENCFTYFVAGSLVGWAVAQPRTVYVQQVQPVYVQQQPQVVYVYPTTAPVFTVPQLGRVCELRSEMINGQIVQGNYCHN